MTKPVTKTGAMAADPGYDPHEFQEVLRAWMDRNSLSQMAAAQTIGISQGIINRWLKPADDPYLVKPTIDSLEKLAPYLRIPLIQLKVMTNNVSPADRAIYAAVQPEKTDHQLESVVSDMREGWSDLGEVDRGKVQDMVRIMLGMHHRRAPRGKPRDKGVTKDEGDTSTRGLLIAAYAG